MMAGHTPAPWAAKKAQKSSNFGGVSVHITARRTDYNGREYIATIAKTGELPNNCADEAAANARLIAAAPDLLEALRTIADMHIGDQPPTSPLRDVEWLVKHIREMRAIAQSAIKLQEKHDGH